MANTQPQATNGPTDFGSIPFPADCDTDTPEGKAQMDAYFSSEWASMPRVLQSLLKEIIIEQDKLNGKVDILLVNAKLKVVTGTPEELIKVFELMADTSKVTSQIVDIIEAAIEKQPPPPPQPPVLETCETVGVFERQ
jgi:hypothetical protein